MSASDVLAKRPLSQLLVKRRLIILLVILILLRLWSRWRQLHRQSVCMLSSLWCQGHRLLSARSADEAECDLVFGYALFTVSILQKPHPVPDLDHATFG